MPTLSTHTPQEISVLYGQLSPKQQDELSQHLHQLLSQTNETSNQKANQDLLALAGSMKTNIKLSNEELDEAIHRSYYARDEQ